jgi:hypothetical protein
MTLPEVSAYCSENLDGLPPARYIFHHAFSCSTLLARCLGRLGAAFIYREPAALTELALIDIDDREFLNTEGGRTMFQAIAQLHRRTEFVGEQPVVKGCDLLTGIIERLLALAPGTRGLLLYSDMEPFVLACLKGESRREWMRNRVPLVLRWGAANPIGTQLQGMSDGELAACLWGTHMKIFKDLENRCGDRVLPLDCEALLTRPTRTLHEVAEFLGLPVEVTRGRAGLRQVHAKTGAPYSAARRTAELLEMRARWPHELSRARNYCNAIGLPENGASFFIRPDAEMRS